jgi:hypothetical protein
LAAEVAARLAEVGQSSAELEATDDRLTRVAADAAYRLLAEADRDHAAVEDWGNLWNVRADELADAAAQANDWSCMFSFVSALVQAALKVRADEAQD